MKPSRIIAVDHVHLEARADAAEALRWFYGEVCVLDEVASCPESPLLCFRSGRIELQISLMDRVLSESMKTRLTISVPSLYESAELLEERAIAYEWMRGLQYTDRRILTFDPAGYRVALRRDWSCAPI